METALESVFFEKSFPERLFHNEDHLRFYNTRRTRGPSFRRAVHFGQDEQGRLSSKGASVLIIQAANEVERPLEPSAKPRILPAGEGSLSGVSFEIPFIPSEDVGLNFILSVPGLDQARSKVLEEAFPGKCLGMGLCREDASFNAVLWPFGPQEASGLVLTDPDAFVDALIASASTVAGAITAFEKSGILKRIADTDALLALLRSAMDSLDDSNRHKRDLCGRIKELAEERSKDMVALIASPISSLLEGVADAPLD